MSNEFDGPVVELVYTLDLKSDAAGIEGSNPSRTTKINNGKPFSRGFDPRRKKFTNEDRIKALEVKENRRKDTYSKASFDELPLAEKRRIILSEQGNKCLCGLSEWQGYPIMLELDHINGKHSDNSRENLRILCPNCHSQTPTFRNRKRG